MPRGLEVSRPLIADTIPSINMSNFFKSKIIYIVIFRVADWDTINAIVLRLLCPLVWEYLFELTNGEYHVFTF
jgi:hypothetical protein